MWCEVSHRFIYFALGKVIAFTFHPSWNDNDRWSSKTYFYAEWLSTDDFFVTAYKTVYFSNSEMRHENPV